MKSAPAFLSALTLTLAFYSLPAHAQSVALNDEFATRENLPGITAVNWTGYGSELTLDLIDAHSISGSDLDDSEMEGSMWFEWTAPEAGVYDFRGGENYGLAVFNTPPPSQPQVPSYSLKKFHTWASYGGLADIAAGERLWIMIFDEGDPEPGDRTSLQITKVTPAPATREAAIVLPGTSSVNIRQPVRGEGWWRWTAPVTGKWRFPAGSGMVTVRTDGSIANDGTPRPFTVAAGEEVFFHAVLQPGALGWAEATLTLFTLPSNLSFNSPQPLTPDADGNGAGLSFPGDSYLTFETTSPEAWFSWVAPRNGFAGFIPWENTESVKTFRDDNGVLARVDAPIGTYRNPWITVAAGERYLIAIPVHASTVVRVEYLSHRGSDSFAAAPAYDPLWERDVFSDATAEPGEPGLTTPSDRTRWWTFTPSTGGTVTLSGYRMRLYTGTALNSLTLITSVDYNAPGHPFSSPVTALPGGITYHLQVFEEQRWTGQTNFQLYFHPNAPGDHFANAEPVSPGTSIYGNYTRLNLTGTTAEAGEPPATPGVPAAHTAWLRWTADRDSRMLMQQQTYYGSNPDPEASTVPPVLAVWKGSALTSLERVPVLPFLTAHYAFSLPSFDAVRGTTYHIQVEAPPTSSDMDFLLTPVFAEVDSCDAFAGALPAERVRASTGITYRMARPLTFEPGESTEGIAPAPNEHTVGTYWIKWTAPSAGVWRFGHTGLWFRPYTLYRDSLAGGRIGFLSSPESEPVFLKLAAGDVVHLGFIEYQLVNNQYQPLYPRLPDITPAVPGIALAKWYGLPSPANLSAAYSSDGLPLLLKHALGLDPLYNSLPGGNDPRASHGPLLTTNPAGEPALSFRPAAPFQTGAGVEVSGEISRDLRTWTSAPETSTGPVRTATLPHDGTAGFLRLKASLR